MLEEHDIDIHIELSYYHYGNDWGATGKTTITYEGKSVTIERESEFKSSVIELIAKDIQECLNDPEEWIDHARRCSPDKLVKLQQWEEDVANYRQQAKTYQQRSVQAQKDADHYQQCVDRLRAEFEAKVPQQQQEKPLPPSLAAIEAIPADYRASHIICRTCGGDAQHHKPSALDPDGIGHPGHKIVKDIQ